MLQNPRPLSEVIETDLEQELVLLNPKTQNIFTLNVTGRFIWQTLHKHTLEEVISKVQHRFAVAPEQARADVLELVAALQQAGLVSSE
jgi:Coenzyme PQQ synthesis protein D (PqqD)